MSNQRQSQPLMPAAGGVPRYSSLADYRERHGSTIVFLRKRLKTYRSNVYGLLYPDRFYFALSPRLVAALAELLNQDPAFIQGFYHGRAVRRRQTGCSTPPREGEESTS